MMKFITPNSEQHQEMIAWRHDFHAYPETAFEETRTAEKIAKLLIEFGLDVHTGIAKTGVVGVLRGQKGKSERMIGLRADIDALNIDEQTGLEYQSTIAGKMHACGHDGHTAMLLGAAKYLAEQPDFAGKVAFIFQPAEESIGGGRVMCEEGLFTCFPCEAVYGMHNWPGLPVGHFAVHSREVMAAAEYFEITVKGKGGHAAMPHLSNDPMMAVTQLISAFQTIISRNLNPFATGVISVTNIEVGSAFNIVPESVKIGGTVRTFSETVREQIHHEMRIKLDGICQAFSATGEIAFDNYYPTTINHPENAEKCAHSILKIVSEEHLHRDLEPSMGAEDFSFMLREKPGAYVWIGNGDSHGLHHPKYNFNDEILPLGANYWTQLVYDQLVV